ncbi:MAG: metal ABC transporter permease [Candidatus Zophobacter franzmannii]|nr:metal ABC transporter permease [Candidatus Zophobacter franzmannii]
MSQLIYDFTHYQFLINALLASVFASIILGLLGPLIVVKRISSICGGIAHSALGGIGVAVFLGLSPMWGAFGASIASALIISYTKLKGSQHEDVMISVIWSLGMAIGLIFIALTPGYSQNILTYLFGNILLVTNSEIITSMLLSFLVFAIIFIFYRQLVVITFDEKFTIVRRLGRNFFFTLLLILVAIAVVTLIKITGMILVIALMTLPSATALLFANRMGTVMLWSVIQSLLYCLTGIIIGYLLNLPIGATIIVISSISYFLLLLLKKSRCCLGNGQ